MLFEDNEYVYWGFAYEEDEEDEVMFLHKACIEELKTIVNEDEDWEPEGQEGLPWEGEEPKWPYDKDWRYPWET